MFQHVSWTWSETHVESLILVNIVVFESEMWQKHFWSKLEEKVLLVDILLHLDIDPKEKMTLMEKIAYLISWIVSLRNTFMAIITP